MLHRYRPDIDGLRAISILLVLGFHAFPDHIRGGFVGVDVFFVISGFLISGIVFTELDAGVFSLTTFYMRRARRIFPALIVVLIFILTVGWLVLFPSDLIMLGHQVMASAAFVANIFFWYQSGYFNPQANSYPLLHLWSLGVEEQFYIAWPLMAIVLWRWRRRLVPAVAIIGLISLTINIVFVEHRVAVFYFPATRAWELMLGAAVALTAFGPTSSITLPRPVYEAASGIGLAMIVSAAFLMNKEMAYPGWRALIPTVGAALVIWSSASSRIGCSLLGAKPAIAIGLISYPLYLWHWPLLWLVRLLYPEANWEIVSAVCVTSVLLAWMTYELIEIPIRHRHTRKPWRTTASLAAMLAISFVLGFVISRDGFPGRWDKNVNALLTYKFDLTSYRVGKCHLAPEQGPLDFASECYSDTNNGTKRIVLWGDSAATALYPGMHSLNDGSFNIAELTSSGCPPFIGDYQPQAERPHCRAINAYVWRYIQSDSPDIVILAAAPSYQTDIPKRMSETVAQLHDIGIRTVIVVGPPPSWPRALPEIILRNYFYSFPRTLSERLKLPLPQRISMSALDSGLKEAVRKNGAMYVSVFNRLCSTEGFCTTLINGTPVSFDQFHLTENSSALVARDIYRLLK